MLTNVIPASAGSPPNRLDDNRTTGEVILVSLALTGLFSFPILTTGRVLAHPKIQNLYWDDNWNAHNPADISTQRIDDFTRKLTASNYFDPASQYGVGSASFAGSHGSMAVCGGDRPGGTVDFFRVLIYTTCSIALLEGGVPPIPGIPILNEDSLLVPYVLLDGTPSPDDDVLYVVYLPTGTKVTGFGLSSCGDFGAYHFMTVVPQLNEVPFPPGVFIFPQSFAFAVVPADCSQGSLRGIGILATHEIIEASTDPIFGLGWIDNSQFDLGHIVNIVTKGEAADICSRVGAVPTDPVTLNNGIVVAPYWSNADNKCVPVRR